jgi:hypothetical protein
MSRDMLMIKPVDAIKKKKKRRRRRRRRVVEVT